MSTLLKNKAHPYELLAAYTQSPTSEDVMADVYSAKYKIVDYSAGYEGSQILPGSGWTTVTTGPGHLGPGRYGAYNAANSGPWIPAAEYARARIVWQIQSTETSTPYTVYREFEVLDTDEAPEPFASLLHVQDVRDEGTFAGKTNLQVHVAIKLWQTIVESYCRQGFSPKYETRSMFGTGASLLRTREAVLLESLRVNGSTTDEVISDYNVATRDTKNPRIRTSDTSPTFQETKRQYVTGAWGCWESSSFGPPELLRHALLLGVTLRLRGLNTVVPAGTITSETTDGHTIIYGSTIAQIRPGMIGLLKNVDIRDILDLFQAPLSIDGPAVASAW